MGLLGRVGAWLARERAAGRRPIRDVIEAALDRDDVQIERGPDVAHATNAVVEAIEATPGVTVATTTTAARDPINWTQFVGIGVWLLAAIGIDADAGTLIAIGTGIQAAIALATAIVRKRSKSVST